ncbi:lysylphosphatidylglycerol synthase transmembrane domain-containing protein [Haloferula sp. BvORR071]|uniref:lysylphosphatidylglycerol synthase transmembrane domain-containing protein n=1 Tax=Haloferula sp. BvORR071 TaxID=1396141 RepID=UPI000558C676|nr:lysylphosphatidylglycerol synthase transmembrane domain-containing protein [Haloferula sp. BvORR071]
MKKWLLFLLKLGLTIGCLYWVLNQDELRQKINQSTSLWPAHPQWEWVAIGILFGGGTIFISALRWWILLRAQDVQVSLRRIVELTLIGNLFNFATVVGGDAAKIFLLIRDHKDKKLTITMSVMVDHLAGLVSMAVTFLVLTAGRFKMLEEHTALEHKALTFAWFYFVGGLVFVGLLFLMASPWVHGRIHKPGKKMRFEILRRVPEIYDIYRKKWPQGLVALAVSFLMLPVYYATFWCGVRFGGEAASFMQVFTVMPVVDAISGMPFSIQGIGVRELFFAELMRGLYGTATEVSVLGSLIGFACSLVWAAVGGILFLRPSDRTTVKEIEDVTHADEPSIN